MTGAVAPSRLPAGDREEALRLARARLDSGQPGAARQSITTALAGGGDARALLLAGRIGLAQGDWAWAAERLADALARTPNDAEAHRLSGRALAALGRHDAAARAFECAVNLKPRNVDAMTGLGHALEALGDFGRAEAIYRMALGFQPEAAGALVNLGNVLQRKGRVEESLAVYRHATAAAPGASFILANMGAALRKIGRDGEAGRVYGRALALDPFESSALYNLGNLTRDAGRPDSAVALFDRALARRGDDAAIGWNRALALLLAGRLEEGFAAYEWRWRYAGFPTKPRDFPQPRWDGGRFDGRTLLVHGEQGLGDSFQFVRYLPMIRALGGRVVFECQDALLPFFAAGGYADAVVPQSGPLPDFDLHLPLMSAPHVLGTGLGSVPAAVPYLRVPDGAGVPLPEATADALNVGLVWAGNPQYANDHQRSMPLAALAPLMAVPGVRLFALQKGEREAEAAAFPAIVRLGPRLASFADTACALARLDLVISVDTAVCHLAGGLGRPVWTMLPFTPDWRWMLERADSPWYPTMRLFRQPRPGDWAAVAEAVGDALTRHRL